jgi:hypothetical protein
MGNTLQSGTTPNPKETEANSQQNAEIYKQLRNSLSNVIK